MSFDLQIVNNDLVIDKGELKQVVDSQKLIQDILKLALTEAGANPLHPWYGSFLSKVAVGSSLDDDIIVQMSRSQLQTALENLKSLQDMQLKTQQSLSADEQIAAISDIFVNRSNEDPRLFNVTITVISKGIKPITTSFRISTI